MGQLKRSDDGPGQSRLFSFLEVIHVELGPFNGAEVEFKRRSGYYNGQLLVSKRAAGVIKAIAVCGALSGNQIRALTGTLSHKSTMTALVARGFVDIYESGKTPPVYTLGQGGAEIMDESYRMWDTIELLRTVAANQLWVCLSRLWPDAGWDPYGEFPVLTKGSSRFLVAAPRMRPGEPVLASRVFNCEGRVIIVAASVEQLKELDPLAPEKVRYTWDALLKDGVTFYRLNGSGLVLDDAFSSENRKVIKKVLTSERAL